MRWIISLSPSALATPPCREYTPPCPTIGSASRYAVAGIVLGASPGALRPAQTPCSRQGTAPTHAGEGECGNQRQACAMLPRLHTLVPRSLDVAHSPVPPPGHPPSPFECHTCRSSQGSSAGRWRVDTCSAAVRVASLHQPFYLLPQPVGPRSVPQVPRVRLIGKDDVPIVLCEFP